MKQSILTVLGAMFILIGFFGGGSFDVGFAKANVEKNSVSPLLRFIAFIFGIAMIVSQSSAATSFFERFSYIHSKDRIETYQVNVISTYPIQSAKVLKGQKLTFYPNESTQQPQGHAQYNQI
jgi:hypothetical protein